MPRRLNLRQVEAFKAVMEHGTVSRGAEALNMSQPAMSKLIAHLEADTGLHLFDRSTGRLAPTDNALRFHDEVERIFAGMRQVESAVEAIRRDEQGRLIIGVMPALAGQFIQRATATFLAQRTNVFCSVQPMSSQWTMDRLVARTLDIGLVSATIEHPCVKLEPLMEHPLVCIMPIDHPMTAKAEVGIDDLHEQPFVGFNPDSYAGSRVADIFEANGVVARTVVIAGAAQTVCEFVAGGIGVSLVHPLMVGGFEPRLAVRSFVPKVLYRYQIARNADNRNARLVDAFSQVLRDTAAQISGAVLGKC